MHSPNILVTNHCNQDCSYCFASSLMKNKRIPKEMSIEDFKMLVKKLKGSVNGISTIKLLGGEPTMHSRFKEIINFSLENFNSAHIFTNGLFSEEIYSFLKQCLPQVEFTFNIITPVFLHNQQMRNIIIERIKELSIVTEAALSITVNPQITTQFILKIIDKELIKQTKNCRFGASNPIAGKNNFYQLSDFLKIGKIIYELASCIKRINPYINIHLDCGFVPCMLTAKQYQFFVNNCIDKTYWGCYLGNMDIQTDLKAIICYSLSEEKKVNIKTKAIDYIENRFILQQYAYLKSYQNSKCKNCQYFGFERNKCSGPCIAFLKNLRKQPLPKSHGII